MGDLQTLNKEAGAVKRGLVGAGPVLKTETVSIPAGVSGTYKNFFLTFKPILDSNHADFGGKGDSSVSLSGSTFTREVAYGTDDSDMAAGDYWVNYMTGEARGRKADSATSLTATYYVMQPMGSAAETPSSSSSAPTRTAITGSSQTIFTSVATIERRAIYNDTTAPLYVLLQNGGTCSSTNFTTIMMPGDFIVLPESNNGDVSVLGTASSGSVQTTKW